MIHCENYYFVLNHAKSGKIVRHADGAMQAGILYILYKLYAAYTMILAHTFPAFRISSDNTMYGMYILCYILKAICDAQSRISLQGDSVLLKLVDCSNLGAVF